MTNVIDPTPTNLTDHQSTCSGDMAVPGVQLHGAISSSLTFPCRLLRFPRHCSVDYLSCLIHTPTVAVSFILFVTWESSLPALRCVYAFPYSLPAAFMTNQALVCFLNLFFLFPYVLLNVSSAVASPEHGPPSPISDNSVPLAQIKAVEHGRTVNLNSKSAVSPELFAELEELSRIVDISYCVGMSGIQRPFKCANRCSDFEGFELVTVSTSAFPYAYRHNADNKASSNGIPDIFCRALVVSSHSLFLLGRNGSLSASVAPIQSPTLSLIFH